MFSGGFSMFHWLILGVIILLLFGKGRFSAMAGDMAKGLKSFKKGLSEEGEEDEMKPVPPLLPSNDTSRVPVAPVGEVKSSDSQHI